MSPHSYFVLASTIWKNSPFIAGLFICAVKTSTNLDKNRHSEQLLKECLALALETQDYGGFPWRTGPGVYFAVLSTSLP